MRHVVRFAFAFAIVLTCRLALASDVLVVAQNAGPGVDYTDLQAAIDAAHDGDIVLMKTFVGGGATISHKGVTVVVDEGKVVTLTTPLAIRNVTAQRFVVVRGVQVDAPLDSSALVIEDCAGTVWIEQCTLNAPVPTNAPTATLSIADSSAVVLVRTKVNGAHAQKQSASQPGAPGVVALGETTRLAAHEVTVTGGNASMGSATHGKPGGDALRFEGLEAFIGASKLTGGNGAHGTIPFGGHGGDGGDCLVVPAVHVNRVWVWGNALNGGQPGSGPPDGAIGETIVDPAGVVVQTGQKPRSTTADATARAGDSLHVVVAISGGIIGPSGIAAAWVGSTPALAAIAPKVGILQVMRESTPLVIGSLSGFSLAVDLPVPPLPTFVGQGVVCFGQTMLTLPTTSTLTSGTAFVLLDPSL